MPWSSTHIRWLVDTGRRLTTADGRAVEVWEFVPGNDEGILSAWAKHFRNHYCLDTEIDLLRNGTGLSRAEYLNRMTFPDRSEVPGPSLRAGDFAEILLADLLAFVEQFWVPRFRYDDKTIRNESTKGVDILAFKFISGGESPEDILVTFEAKARLTGRPRGNRLQDAVDGSVKDFPTRTAQSLNALKRRFIRSGNGDDASRVERFQNRADRPYRAISGAAAVFSTAAYQVTVISTTGTASHPNRDNLRLIVITGDDLMRLVHSLYERAADEA